MHGIGILMGNDTDACNYCYKLEIEDGDHVDEEKFVFEGIPRSLREDRLTIMERGQALIVPRTLSRLEIAVEIWKIK